jgi:hypothetical protein
MKLHGHSLHLWHVALPSGQKLYKDALSVKNGSTFYCGHLLYKDLHSLNVFEIFSEITISRV